MTRAEQSDEELLVFRHFVEVSTLPIILDTIEKRPPDEPDIRCIHQSAGLVAFELTEICNESLVAMLGRSPKLGELLYSVYDTLPAEMRQKFSSRFKTQALSFQFHDSASMALIRGTLPLLFEELITARIEADCIRRFLNPRVKRIIASVRFAGRADSESVNMNIGGYLRPTDRTISTIEGKLSKSYPTDLPLELIAYTRGRHITPANVWIPNLEAFLSSRGNLGSFQRVWVLDGETLYSYPPHNKPLHADCAPVD